MENWQPGWTVPGFRFGLGLFRAVETKICIVGSGNKKKPWTDIKK